MKNLSLLKGFEGNVIIHMSQEKRDKSKAHLRIGHEVPEGELRHSPTLSLNWALDGGGWSTPRPGRFTPRKDPVPIV
jgi:hypothetical protein